MNSDTPVVADATTPAVPRAIVAGHGEFAAGLISAVEQITGRGGQLVPIVVLGLGLTEIEELIRSRMTDANVSVIFTDLQAGSCTMAARRLLRGHPEAVLVAGANLPMLLDFVFSDGTNPAGAARHAAERGRVAVSVHGAGE